MPKWQSARVKTGINKVGVASSVGREWSFKKASATTQILLPGPYQAELQLLRDASYINAWTPSPLEFQGALA